MATYELVHQISAEQGNVLSKTVEAGGFYVVEDGDFMDFVRDDTDDIVLRVASRLVVTVRKVKD
jgi:hypothetical protein